jgi:hypothetical protein
VQVFGEALAEQPPQQTGDDGGLALTGLDGDDRLIVRAEAPGYLPASRTTTGITLADGTGDLVLELLPAAGLLSGRVVSDNGPVARACVSDGRFSTLTDAAGQFQLAVSDRQSTLRLAATGYAAKEVGPATVTSGGHLGDLRLERLTRPATVLVVNARPFGAPDGDLEPLAGLYASLTGAGYLLLRPTEAKLPDLGQIDIVFLPVPAASLPAAERQALTEWVRLGGKLIVLGEWGGFGGFSREAANEILQPCNLAFGEDGLRALAEPDGDQGWLTLLADDEPGLWEGVDRIRLRSAASVRVVADTTVPLDSKHTHPVGRLGSDGMRIASVWGQFSPIGVALVGAGRVIAIGDASLWAADPGRPGGTMDHLNRLFALNVFRW